MRKHPVMSIEGFEELNEALRSVGLRAGGLILRNATEEGAEIIAEEARKNAPRGQDPSPASEQYGRLHENIGTREHRTQHGRAQVDVTRGDAFWGDFLEKGTSRMPAQPWLRPALDARAEEAKEAVADSLRRQLRDVLD